MESATLQNEFTTNISGKVRNTNLPRNKALWPLFEVISNGIHAIEEKGNTKSGQIQIDIIRNGDQETLHDMENVEVSPIHSLIVKDNGIGFNDQNYQSFLTAESEYKIEKGAKGIGRFVCLKAFRSVKIESIFATEGNKKQSRSFVLQSTGKGIFEYNSADSKASSTGTIVTLTHFREEYQQYAPKTLRDLGEKIIEHFLVYFVLEKCPYIKLIDNNNKSILLQDLYGSTIKSKIIKDSVKIGRETFEIHLVRLYEAKGAHKLHYCANDREVSDESLTKYILDLGKQMKDEDGNEFTYQCYVTGNYLDSNVDTERTNFTFPTGDSESDDDNKKKEELSLKEIRNAVITKIEEILKDYLNRIRESKFTTYKTHINASAPQFKPIVKYKPESIKRLPPNLSGNKLNIELFKLQAELELEVKKIGEEILGDSKSINTTDEYITKYNDYIEKFNDIGKSNLANYIVHRKAVIELLDLFLGVDEEGKYQTEDTIHRIFFPLKTESDEITYEQQNLWLIDERLSYHNYLSSDKSFKEMPILENVDSKDRPDLLIFNDSFAFVNDEAPHNSFVIVEFKRPERQDYTSAAEKKNPVDQVISYIRTIRENKAVDRRGKLIQLDKEKTPFYAYIICDFNVNLAKVLEDRNYKRTPDNLGFFYFHETYNAYIEVVSYQKLLKDAKSRNRILFEKLGLPY